MDNDTREGINLYYNIKIEALFMYAEECFDIEEYQLFKVTNDLNMLVQEQYIEFRLKNYESDYKCFIRDKVYKDIYKYNPYRRKK
jgi:hypothetical protein